MSHISLDTTTAEIDLSHATNVEETVENNYTRIATLMVRLVLNGIASLEAARDLGRELIILKGLLPHGTFTPTIAKRFQISRQWAARLMRLANSWLEIEKARNWADSAGLTLGRSEFSTDGALRLLRHYQNAEGDLGAFEQGLQQKSKSSKKALASTDSSALQEALDELDRSADRIAELESTIDALEHSTANFVADRRASIPQRLFTSSDQRHHVFIAAWKHFSERRWMTDKRKVH